MQFKLNIIWILIFICFQFCCKISFLNCWLLFVDAAAAILLLDWLRPKPFVATFDMFPSGGYYIALVCTQAELIAALTCPVEEEKPCHFENHWIRKAMSFRESSDHPAQRRREQHEQPPTVTCKKPWWQWAQMHHCCWQFKKIHARLIVVCFVLGRAWRLTHLKGASGSSCTGRPQWLVGIDLCREHRHIIAIGYSLHSLFNRDYCHIICRRKEVGGMRPAERAGAERALVVNCATHSHHGSGPLCNIAMSDMILMCSFSCAATLVDAIGGRIKCIVVDSIE